MKRLFTVILVTFVLAACASKPLVPYSTDTPPLVLLPATDAGIEDGRGRFREISCAVLEAHGKELPHYRDCEDALTRLGNEPEPSGEPINLTLTPLKSPRPQAIGLPAYQPMGLGLVPFFQEPGLSL